MPNQQLVWVVTGTSSGIGRELVLKILARGDKAIATARARSFSKLADLKAKGAYTYELDVTAPDEDLQDFARRVIEEHGHVDVIVNNAGFVANGAQESSTRDEVLAQFNTNVFAPLNINRVFLPHMRSRKTGWILWIGSYAGWEVTPIVSIYAASKHALRALATGLNKEISPFGLRSVCFEFGCVATNVFEPGSMKEGESRIAAYDQMTEMTNGHLRALKHNLPGDIAKAAELIIDAVHGEGAAAGRVIPPFVAVGSDAYTVIAGELASAKQGLEEWKDFACSTDF